MKFTQKSQAGGGIFISGWVSSAIIAISPVAEFHLRHHTRAPHLLISIVKERPHRTLIEKLLDAKGERAEREEPFWRSLVSLPALGRSRRARAACHLRHQ
jgi:hypothetical protein